MQSYDNLYTAIGLTRAAELALDALEKDLEINIGGFKLALRDRDGNWSAEVLLPGAKWEDYFSACSDEPKHALIFLRGELHKALAATPEAIEAERIAAEEAA